MGLGTFHGRLEKCDQLLIRISVVHSNRNAKRIYEFIGFHNLRFSKNTPHGEPASFHRVHMSG